MKIYKVLMFCCEDYLYNFMCFMLIITCLHITKYIIYVFIEAQQLKIPNKIRLPKKKILYH